MPWGTVWWKICSLLLWQHQLPPILLRALLGHRAFHAGQVQSQAPGQGGRRSPTFINLTSKPSFLLAQQNRHSSLITYYSVVTGNYYSHHFLYFLVTFCNLPVHFNTFNMILCNIPIQLTALFILVVS